MKFATKAIRQYPPHLRHVATLAYIAKLKIQIFSRCGRKRKQITFLIASTFVIHLQILIFSVFKIACLSVLIVNKIFRVTLLLRCTFTINLCPHWRKRWDS